MNLIKSWNIACWENGRCSLLFQLNLIWSRWYRPKLGKIITNSMGWTHVQISFVPFEFLLTYREDK